MKTLKQRRQKSKTDYSKRIELLKSESPRIVFRKTNRYIVAQYVVSKGSQDKIIFGVNSKDLIKYGWPEKFKGSLKSIPASYLTGYLIGKQINKKKLETPITDFGMHRVLPKSKTHSFIKGLVDAGIKIKYKKDNFIDENRIRGKHLKEDFSGIFDKIKSKINEL